MTMEGRRVLRGEWKMLRQMSTTGPASELVDGEDTDGYNVLRC